MCMCGEKQKKGGTLNLKTVWKS